MIQLQCLNHILSKKDSSMISLNNLNEDYFSDYKDAWNGPKTGRVENEGNGCCFGFSTFESVSIYLFEGEQGKTSDFSDFYAWAGDRFYGWTVYRIGSGCNS